jgi:alkylation response protein AidB-like acyl-CoA dehydrogenase
MFGTPEQRAKYLPAIAKGDYLAAFGLTEPGAGTDLNKLSTTAELSADGKHWKLNGEKIFITGVPDSGVAYFVAGKTRVNGEDQGPTVFVVDLPFRLRQTKAEKKQLMYELAQKGLRITPFSWSDQKDKSLEMMMIRGSDQSYIQFKDFQVPVADEKGIPNILGQQGNGKKVPLLSLNAGRAGFGPLAAASATRLADLSTEHAIDRLMFDMYSKDPEAPGREADMQIVKKHLGQMSINGAMARAASKLVAGLIDANPDRGVAGLSAMIKVMTTDMNFENAQKALDLHGGHGLIKGAPNQMERFFRDAWILLIVEGQNAAMRLFSVLTGSSPVRKAFEKGLKELENRAKHLPSNVGTELKLLASGKIQEAKQHHQETSLFTVSEFKPLIKAQLGKAEQGILSEDEAYWIQSRTLQFSRNFGYVGMRLQERVAQRQNDLARVANIMQDLFQITAAQIELAKMGDKLDPKEKAYLQTGTKLAKARVDRELKFVSMAGNPEEHLLVEAGERAIEADKGVVRPNKQDEHMAFLHGKADKFHQKLAKEFGKQ